MMRDKANILGVVPGFVLNSETYLLIRQVSLAFLCPVFTKEEENV